MKPFGLYFTRNHSATDKPIRKCRDWNFCRIYASIILVVTWLNAFRYAAVFDGKETPGSALFMKLGIIPAALLNIAYQTAYYIASHTGTLDRVIRQAGAMSVADLSPKYCRRTKLVLAVCWLLIAWNLFHYIYQLFTNGRLNDLTLIILNRTVSESCLYVIKAVLVLLQLQTIATWILPQAMKLSQVLTLPRACLIHVFYVFVTLSSSNELHGDDSAL